MPRRLVREAMFDLDRGKYAIISVNMLGSGLSRVIVQRDRRGRVSIRATNGPAGGRFEFDDRKSAPNACDFWVARAEPKISIADMLRSSFWGQFTWGEMDKLRRDPQLQGRLTMAIRKLADEFEGTAARRLNRMVRLKQLRRTRGNR